MSQDERQVVIASTSAGSIPKMVDHALRENKVFQQIF